MSGSASLVEIKEGETLVVESAAEEGEEEDEGALEEGDALLSESGLFPPPAVAATEEGGAVEVAIKSSATGDSPLTKILEGESRGDEDGEDGVLMRVGWVRTGGVE
jgi:hypothetical protein